MFLAVLLSSAALFTYPKNVSSTIRSVTVYGDRALILRSAATQVETGPSTLCIANLPVTLVDNSVRVTGEAAGATIVDVRVETAYLDTIPEENIKQLQSKIEDLQGQLLALNDQIANLNEERNFLQQIKAQSADNISKDLKVQRPTVDDWQKILTFLQNNYTRITGEIRSREKNRAELQKKLEAAQRQLNLIAPGSRRAVKNIVIEIKAVKPGEVKLTSGYVVFGARWYPHYNIRVSREAGDVQLEYGGMVQQNTGEAWNDVELVLSTARPDIGGVKPELPPWFVNIFEPVKPKGMAMDQLQELTMQRAPMGKPEVEAVTPMNTPAAEVEMQTTSAVFRLPSKISIPSDNVPHAASIAYEKLTADFSYSSTPKLSPFVYLKAVVKNSTDYPFLAGEMNVFTEKEFIGQSRLPLVAPNESFDAYLGVDPSLKIERKLINRFTENTGTFTKNVKTTYEFAFTAENTKKTDVTLTVQDQIPVSQNEKIVVELIEPPEKQLKPTDQGALLWNLPLHPAEKKSWKLKFSIEYPSNSHVAGID